MRSPAFGDERSQLAEVDRFVAAAGSLSTRNPSGYPSPSASALAVPTVATAYDQAVADFVRL